MQEIVSIILPNYNHSNYLHERLNSIFKQSYQNFEVIILDDCSSDESLTILNSYKNHEKVSHFIVNIQNSGSPFLQWQKGLQLAKGSFIWIAESDDYCDLNFLESQLKVLKTADVAVARTLAFANDTVNTEVFHPIFDDNKQEESILYCPILNVSSVLFRASLLEDIKDEYFAYYKIIGDRVFYFEFFLNSKVIYNPKATNYFRQSVSNISKLNDRNIAYYSNYFKEHCQFISYAKYCDPTLSKNMYKRYINKFFNRVRDRVPKKQKLSFNYFCLFVSYKLMLLKY